MDIEDEKSASKGRTSEPMENNKTILPIVTENKEGFKVVNLSNLTAKEIVKLTVETLKCATFGGAIPRRAQCLTLATKLFGDAGYTISSKEIMIEELIEDSTILTSKILPTNSITEKVSLPSEIINKDEELHNKATELKEEKTISKSCFDNMTAKQIIVFTTNKLKCPPFGGFIPRRANTLEKALVLFTKFGYIIK